MLRQARLELLEQRPAVVEPSEPLLDRALRLLALLTRNELTVSELTWILGQSQPRVSRHLKLLSDARLVERIQEGAWAFYRLADKGPATEILTALVSLLPEDVAELERDRQRLETVKRDRAVAAAAYFRDIADSWDRIRDLYVAEADVEQATGFGPSMVASSSPLPELMESAGFSEVSVTDVTDAFEAACDAILSFRAGAETDLRAEEGDELFDDQVGKKTRMREGVRLGLLERSMVIGRVP